MILDLRTNIGMTHLLERVVDKIIGTNLLLTITHFKVKSNFLIIGSNQECNGGNPILKIRAKKEPQ